MQNPNGILAHPREGAFIFILIEKERIDFMKKTLRTVLSVIMLLTCLLGLASCKEETPDATGLWANAMYTEDTELGSGSKTIVVEIEAEDKSVKFTIKTDKKTVGEALLEHKLISGEDGDYGIYIKTANGILADYDVDQHYWAVYIGDETAMTGVDGVEVTDGATYKLVYTEI